MQADNPSLFDFQPMPSHEIPLGSPTVPLDIMSRQELMTLSKKLRAMADAIDMITKVKPKKAADENGEPTFKFAAKVSLPENFYLTKKMSAYALEAGFSMFQTATMAETFVTFYRKGGKKWQDWTSVWMTWVRREKERIATAPKQRVTSGQLAKW